MHPLRLVLLVAALASTAVLPACGEDEDEDEGPLMAPGSACISCHREFSAAGTVYGNGTAAADAGLAGVTVTITGNNGRTRTLTTNAAGNFYTSENLTTPLTITVTSASGSRTATGHTSGDCGACHQPGSPSPSRVHVGACAGCH